MSGEDESYKTGSQDNYSMDRFLTLMTRHPQEAIAERDGKGDLQEIIYMLK